MRRAGARIQASTAAAICLSWGSPAAIIKHRPVTKRPKAIHLGSMANLIVAPTTCRHRNYGARGPSAMRLSRGATAQSPDGLLFTPATDLSGSGASGGVRPRSSRYRRDGERRANVLVTKLVANP